VEDEELDRYVGIWLETGLEDLSMEGLASGGGIGVDEVLKN
jgi:hypothetical protein